MTQGTLSPTGADLNVAIRGEGFFKVLMPDAPSPTRATARSRWTRRAASSPPRATSCSPASASRPTHRRSRSARRARSSATLPGSSSPSILGQLALTRFVNKAGLQAIGDNLFVETPASGTPQDGVPNTDGYGDVQQGNLEQANVEAVTEISDLIAAQRAYEMNGKVITAADQMLSATFQPDALRSGHDPPRSRSRNGGNAGPRGLRRDPVRGAAAQGAGHRQRGNRAHRRPRRECRHCRRRPVFRAPDLGQTGAVPIARVADALRPYDIAGLDSSGLSEVGGDAVVTGADRQGHHRRIARAFAGQYGFGDAQNLAVILDRDIRILHVEPTVTADLVGRNA